MMQNPFKKKAKSIQPNIIQPKKEEQCIVGKFVRLQDVLNFFKYDIAPSNMEARTEKLAAKHLLGQRAIPMSIILMIGALILFGGIGYMMINNSNQNGACVDLAKQVINQNSKVVQNPAVTQPQGTAPTLIK